MALIGRIVRKVKRDLLFQIRKREATKRGISFKKPNYIFLNKFEKDACLIDVGCADDADFSMFVIETLGLKSIGVDPTKKHHSSLEYLKSKHNGKFDFAPFAVASENGNLTFHESEQFASGSLIGSHQNMKRDNSSSYDVEAVTLTTLLKKLGMAKSPYIKLDLEGAEYALLRNIKEEELKAFDQIFIEFHHHAFEEYTQSDTLELVNRIGKFGFQAFSLDDHNFLFYR